MHTTTPAPTAPPPINYDGIRSTHWATRDRERFATLIAALPAVLETEFDLWQMRVDSKDTRPPNEYPKTDFFFIIEANEYAQKIDERGSVLSPTGRSFSFIVTAKDGETARKKVERQLDYHGLNHHLFSVSVKVRELILA
jgi:hypothetical protein